MSVGRSHLLTTALHLHHVNITSNHVTAIIHSKYCAYPPWSSFSAQLMLLTKQLSLSTDQGRPWVCPKVTFAWYSLRLEFLLMLRKGMSGRPVRPAACSTAPQAARLERSMARRRYFCTSPWRHLDVAICASGTIYDQGKEALLIGLETSIVPTNDALNFQPILPYANQKNRV